jgi:hypothetical protein
LPSKKILSGLNHPHMIIGGPSAQAHNYIMADSLLWF